MLDILCDQCGYQWRLKMKTESQRQFVIAGEFRCPNCATIRRVDARVVLPPNVPDQRPPPRCDPAIGSALVWSSDYPKTPGLYWVRNVTQNREMVSLTGDPGNLKMMFYDERVGLHNLPDHWLWQWAGPIPEPQEPNAPGERPGKPASQPTSSRTTEMIDGEKLTHE